MRHTRYALTALGAISALIGTALLSACGGGGLSGLNGNNENAGNTTQFGSLSVQLIGATPVSAAGPEATITGAAGTLSGANLYDHKGKIVFSLWDGGPYDLYLINDDGTGLTRLTAISNSSEAHPFITPDGRFVVHVIDSSGSRRLRLFDLADPTQARLLTNETRILSAPSISANREIVYEKGTFSFGQSDLYLTNLDATESTSPTKISRDNNQYDEWLPMWSPDGKQIIFTSNEPSGTGGREDFDLQLAERTSDGNWRFIKVSPYTQNDDELFPSFAPDYDSQTGGWIVFVRRSKQSTWWSDSTGNHSLYIARITIDRSTPDQPTATLSDEQLITSAGRLIASPFFSPDGTKIVYAKRLNPSYTADDGIYIINRDGTNETRLYSRSGTGNLAFWHSNWVARGVTPLVGQTGVLGQSAGGFLYGETSEGPVSFLVFDVENPANRGSLRLQLLTGQSNAGVHVFNITGTSSAPINRMEYIDLTVKTAFSGEQGIKQRLIGGNNPVFAQSAQAVLVSMSGKTGKLTSVMPYSLTRSAPEASVQGNVQVLRGEFLGVYDPETGKNLAPNGAREVHIDLQTGAVLKVQ